MWSLFFLILDEYICTQKAFWFEKNCSIDFWSIDLNITLYWIRSNFLPLIYNGKPFFLKIRMCMKCYHSSFVIKLGVFDFLIITGSKCIELSEQNILNWLCPRLWQIWKKRPKYNFFQNGWRTIKPGSEYRWGKTIFRTELNDSMKGFF